MCYFDENGVHQDPEHPGSIDPTTQEYLGDPRYDKVRIIWARAHAEDEQRQPAAPAAS